MKRLRRWEDEGMIQKEGELIWLERWQKYCALSFVRIAQASCCYELVKCSGIH